MSLKDAVVRAEAVRKRMVLSDMALINKKISEKSGITDKITIKKYGKLRKAVAAILTFAVMISACACTSSGEGNGGASAAGADDNWTITLTGLDGGDKSIALDELKKLDSVTERAEANRSNGEKVKIKATGPLLSTVLDELGVDISDYNTVRFNADDGYSIAIPPDILKKSDIIIAYENGGKALPEADGPVRAVIVGQRAMYWVRMLKSIDFESDAGVQVADRVVFLDTVLNNAQSIQGLEKESIEINGSTEECVSTSRLIAQYANINDNTVQNVYMNASDGLSKNEKKDNFLGKYLTITGENAPEFNAPGLQEGMSVKGLLTVNYGDTAFFSAAQGLKCMGLTEADGHDALPLSGILRKIGSMSTDVYKFTDIKGKTYEFTADELVDPGVYLENGNAVFSAGTSGSFGITIQGLVMIEAVESK